MLMSLALGEGSRAARRAIALASTAGECYAGGVTGWPSRLATIHLNSDPISLNPETRFNAFKEERFGQAEKTRQTQCDSTPQNQLSSSSLLPF
jgi:hypothetical protein